ncbi:hypothetical protein SADUNF_Sadunf09G0069600 [Salix dunnii]|uniref:Rhodopsin n=1 Tax=Salix dunnii TaxID=1413687 RepID=A0A835JTD6_9ROSI|nr:hypothetical protein SADUNF_Sadunf09G0069600 [Salix dunnii]
MSYYNQQQPPVGVPPPQGYPPEGYPKDAYPPQGYPPQGYPQGYPPQGYPPQGYPPPYAPQYGQPPNQHQGSSGPVWLPCAVAVSWMPAFDERAMNMFNRLDWLDLAILWKRESSKVRLHREYMPFLELLFGSHIGKSGNTRESTANIFLWHYCGGNQQETLFVHGAGEVISFVSTSLSPFYTTRNVYQ